MAMVGRGVGRELAGDVFPALGAFIGCGAAVGSAAVMIAAELMGRAGGSLLTHGAFGGTARRDSWACSWA